MQSKDLGIMRPVGGGDPVPLRKTELIVGRRAGCDIVLDFHNISGKHCMLRFLNQIWHVRDLGSTNGTTINGAPISSEHSIMPDDEVGFAHHIFQIDYEPGAPSSILQHGQVLEDDILETRQRTSLLKLAGIDTDGDSRHPRRHTKAPETIEHASADEVEFQDDLPDDFQAAPAKIDVAANDDDFLKFIEEDVLGPPPKGE